MEISAHNVRQVFASLDAANQTNKGETSNPPALNQPGILPEKPGDTTKVVVSREAEHLKNDGKEKPTKENLKKKQKEVEEEELKEVAVKSIDSRVGNIVDFNA